MSYKAKRRSVIGFAVVIALLFGFLLIATTPYRIPASSMEPTLNCAKPGVGCLGSTDDRVLACRLCFEADSPSRGDIVVFKTPPAAAEKCGEGGTFVKRLIGLPGDTLQEKAGYVYINGKKLNEPYIKASRRDFQTHKMSDIPPGGLARIPKGMYLMMGDNRAQSCDSRVWGLVPRKNLIGEVFFTYWPPNRISFH